MPTLASLRPRPTLASPRLLLGLLCGALAACSAGGDESVGMVAQPLSFTPNLPWPAGVGISLTALETARRLGHPDREGIAFDAGRLHRLRGDYAAAATEFRKALALRPNWAEAQKELRACERMLK